MAFGSASLMAIGLGLNEIRVGEVQSRIQTQGIESKMVIQCGGARIFGACRDSGQCDQSKRSLPGEEVLRRTYLWAARNISREIRCSRLSA